jgi:predicted DNA-binding transcriptional regulator AlpA
MSKGRIWDDSHKKWGQAKAEIYEAASLGLTVREASSKYGLTVRTVYTLISKYGLKLPRPGKKGQEAVRQC